MDELLKLFKLRNSKFENIESANQNIGGVTLPRLKTAIAPTRDDSISFERNDIADFKAFSDGSGQEEGIGASAILYKRGFIRPVKIGRASCRERV